MIHSGEVRSITSVASALEAYLQTMGSRPVTHRTCGAQLRATLRDLEATTLAV